MKEQVAILLVIANLPQRLGTRPPSVRLPWPGRRGACSATGVASRRPVVGPQRRLLQPRHHGSIPLYLPSYASLHRRPCLNPPTHSNAAHWKKRKDPTPSNPSPSPGERLHLHKIHLLLFFPRFLCPPWREALLKPKTPPRNVTMKFRLSTTPRACMTMISATWRLPQHGGIPKGGKR